MRRKIAPDVIWAAVSHFFSALPVLISYPTGVQVSDEELAGLALERDGFHGEWNYVLFPQ